VLLEYDGWSRHGEVALQEFFASARGRIRVQDCDWQDLFDQSNRPVLEERLKLVETARKRRQDVTVYDEWEGLVE